MKYTIQKVEKILEDGVATKQLLTLECERESGKTSQHGKHIALDADPKEEAIIFAAELELVLTEEPEITTEEVEIAEKDKNIKSEDIQSRLDARAEELQVNEVIED